jgi:hypothetical protein
MMGGLNWHYVWFYIIPFPQIVCYESLVNPLIENELDWETTHLYTREDGKEKEQLGITSRTLGCRMVEELPHDWCLSAYRHLEHKREVSKDQIQEAGKVKVEQTPWLSDHQVQNVMMEYSVCTKIEGISICPLHRCCPWCPLHHCHSLSRHILPIVAVP